MNIDIQDNFEEAYNDKIVIENMATQEKIKKKGDKLSCDVPATIQVSKDNGETFNWPEKIEAKEDPKGKVEITKGVNCDVSYDEEKDLWVIKPIDNPTYFTLKITKNKSQKKEGDGDPDATVTIGEPPLP